MKKINLFLISIFALVFSTNVVSQDVSDAGLWSAANDSKQGLNFIAVGPTLFANTSLIVFWYTYDSEGNQLWFISDNVRTDSRYQRVELFNPICSFRVLSDACDEGPAIGVLDISKQGSDAFDIRFALDESVGLAAGCDLNPIAPRPSPAPPALPAEFECQGEMVVVRVAPPPQ